MKRQFIVSTVAIILFSIIFMSCNELGIVSKEEYDALERSLLNELSQIRREKENLEESLVLLKSENECLANELEEYKTQKEEYQSMLIKVYNKIEPMEKIINNPTRTSLWEIEQLYEDAMKSMGAERTFYQSNSNLLERNSISVRRVPDFIFK